MNLLNIKLTEISEYFYENNTDAFITGYIQNIGQNTELGAERPCVIICPGGGYLNVCSDREGEPVALEFLAKGFNAFVLNYSVAPVNYPTQLLELSATIAYIRENADKFMIDENKITVCGFSAGGHLVGNLGVSWQEKFVRETLNIQPEMNKPNSLIMCYPVVTSGEFAHTSSIENLLGENKSDSNLNNISIEKLVTKNMPPVFLWHTCEDQVVDVENSMLLAISLRNNNIPFEAHFYEKGKHGLSLANKCTTLNEEYRRPHINTWFKLALEWLDGQ